ncbi:ANTAR domain-containing protein [Amycolatopsis sp. NPDC004368]
MLLRACSAETAFALLRELSQHTNVKVHDVAAVVVAGSRRPSRPTLMPRSSAW